MSIWPNKDPEAVLDYAIDWSAWLDGDTITSSVWEVPAGLTVGASSNTTTISTIWLSDGVHGSSYQVKNTIETASGRTDRRSVLLTVGNK